MTEAVKTNRELIESELQAVLTSLEQQHDEVRAADAALRAKRAQADDTRAKARNLRMAAFALDGEVGKTVADADAANDAALAQMGA